MKYIMDIDALIECLEVVSGMKINGDIYIPLNLTREFIRRFPKEEVCNLIYWRQLDATRNSIQMVGQANFSHKELQNRSCNQIQDMLMMERGINWNDFPIYQKRGSCCVKSTITSTFAKEEADGTVTTGAIERPHWYIDSNIPIFKGEDREYIDKLIRVDDGCPCNVFPDKVFIN